MLLNQVVEQIKVLNQVLPTRMIQRYFQKLSIKINFEGSKDHD